MKTTNLIEAVIKNWKRLDEYQKKYILGVMQGILLAREHKSKRAESTRDQAS